MYTAVAICTTEVLSVKGFNEEFNDAAQFKTVLYCDNTSAMNQEKTKWSNNGQEFVKC